MAEIPSDIASSAAQAGVQGREVAKDREARRTGQADTAARQIRTTDEAGSTVDTNDADVAIFADAEGTGSAGRETEEEQPGEGESGEVAPDGRGITKDEDGRTHVDLEA